MVTATLPSLTDESDDAERDRNPRRKNQRISRQSIAFSVESELTITPERYTRTVSSDSSRNSRSDQDDAADSPRKTSALAGYVGLATGCGALVALTVFLPLPTRFGNIDKVTQAEAVSYSFYVVGAVALVVAASVFFGLRNLKGEEGKGWALLLGLRKKDTVNGGLDVHGEDRSQREVSLARIPPPVVNTLADSQQKTVPFLHLLKDSVLLGITDSRITLGYIGGFVARASTVAISLFVPLFINTFFIGHGFCQGSPNDPSPELKKECRAAYVLSSILTGVAQLVALICAPIFGYLSHRPGRVNWPIIVSTVFGMVGYIILPQLPSPEIKDVDGRGGTPAVFLVVAMIGVSQIGSIVCSLGSLGQGVLAVELPRTAHREPSIAPDEHESTEAEPLIRITTQEDSVARIRLKGSIAGVYSLCGGAAILLLTKLGGYLFDKLSTGAPFYMMAVFNGILLVVSLLLDASHTFGRN
jgi:hypothetical protein